MDQAKHGAIEYLFEIYQPHHPPLKWPEVKRATYWYAGVLSDDDDDGPGTDNLMLLFVENRGALSIDADEDGDILIRFDVETGDVLGLEIDDFESHFLKKRPELAAGWAALKPEGKNGFHRTPWLTDAPALDYARRLKDLAYQGTLAPGWPFEDLESIAAIDDTFRRPLPQLSRPDNGDGGGG